MSLASELQEAIGGASDDGEQLEEGWVVANSHAKMLELYTSKRGWNRKKALKFAKELIDELEDSSDKVEP